ncbi:uncharacterized protein EAE98_008843 [Botrytis deweyae]|uniref:Heterokaryon incompatibility domain-containing protein n=1 Tax=Botrytis deweyae TaxID=2478750 RepID=A0ABQ7ID82_9HELO|nr:uncharacterized protein EAE98_008843 [Botrytis deweyae]KAF7920814.1 hypothetical protein EAE98_008843 [Botrytis deweyae]
MSASFYTPLKESEIRVLEILPSEDFSENINTTCRIISLASDTSTEAYVALSYTWGEPNDTSYICVNGYKHKVTPNLESALRHLRDDKNTIIIWVDAVCINQNDIPERDRQLQMMADVYKKAEMGLSWLGEESDDSSLALRMIQRWASFSIPLLDGDLREFFESKLEDEILMPKSFAALKNLLQRPYWKRVWIQQEVALPPMVTMQCGHERLSFDAISEFTCTMASIRLIGMTSSRSWLDPDLISDEMDIAPLLNLHNCRNSKLVDCTRDKTPSLFNYLYLSSILKSTDPRDHIYALLGLPHLEKYRSLLRPSYTKSVSHVFSEAAHIMIEEKNSLKPIAFACSLYCPDISLPSWVPDWTARSFKLLPLTHFKGKSLGPVANLSDFVSFSADGQVLSVTGLLYDEVSFLKGCYATTSMMNYGEWKVLSDLKDNSLPNGLTVLEAVFRIFVGMDANTTLDSYRKENVLKFNCEATTFAMIMCDETDRFSTLKILLGQDSSNLPEISKALNEPANEPDFDQFNEETVFEKFRQLSGRMFFVTKNGTLGAGPPDLIPGDKIFHLIGWPEDFILRKVNEHYRLIGDTRIARAALPSFTDGGYEIIEIH